MPGHLRSCWSSSAAAHDAEIRHVGETLKARGCRADHRCARTRRCSPASPRSSRSWRSRAISSRSRTNFDRGWGGTLLGDPAAAERRRRLGRLCLCAGELEGFRSIRPSRPRSRQEGGLPRMPPVEVEATPQAEVEQSPWSRPVPSRIVEEARHGAGCGGEAPEPVAEEARRAGCGRSTESRLWKKHPPNRSPNRWRRNSSRTSPRRTTGVRGTVRQAHRTGGGYYGRSAEFEAEPSEPSRLRRSRPEASRRGSEGRQRRTCRAEPPPSEVAEEQSPKCRLSRTSSVEAVEEPERHPQPAGRGRTRPRRASVRQSEQSSPSIGGYLAEQTH